MKSLRTFLDRMQPMFLPGGRFARYHALFEMVDTLFYSPPDLTRGAPHVRDAIDLKRVMILVVFAAAPCVLIGLWNTGFQANTAMTALGMDSMTGWRGSVLSLLFAGNNPSSVYDNFMLGLSYFLPIYIVTMAAGGFWEILFSGVRNHEINEGFFVTSLLYALILPATIPFVAGRHRHQLRRRHRQGSLRRHRQEFPESLRSSAAHFSILPTRHRYPAMPCGRRSTDSAAPRHLASAPSRACPASWKPA